MVKSSLKLECERSKTISESESESEEEFDPGLFGLLDNPGVVRFGCVDYPLAVTEYSGDEHNTAPDWIRVSYDDLNLDIDTAQHKVKDMNSDCKKLSRSLNDIHTIYSDAYSSDSGRWRIPTWNCSHCDCCRDYLER